MRKTIGAVAFVAAFGVNSMPAGQTSSEPVDRLNRAPAGSRPASSLSGPVSGQADLPGSPPNVIVILTDDQEARSIEYMPNLQALLMDQGTNFRNAFVTTSLCCPSRSSILRGQYAHNHGVWWNLPSQGGGYPKFRVQGHEESTIATWLEDAGYRTALVGKYINAYPTGVVATYVPPGWTEWYAPIAPFDLTYFDFKMNENGIIVEYPPTEENYRTDIETGKAVDFIQRSTSPFFLYVAPWAPHKEIRVEGSTPPVPAARHDDSFVSLTAPVSASFNESDLSDKPTWMRTLPFYGAGRIQLTDELYRRRIESLQSVDDMIAEIHQALSVKGILDSTVIIFMSDNGHHFAEHRLFPGKALAYEEDIRVPLVIRGPGFPVGQDIDDLVLNIDLAPTIADLAGVEPADFVDGRSFLPLLGGGPIDWRKLFLVERKDNGPETVFGPPYSACRTDQHKYVEWATGEIELYELVGDPFETESQHESLGRAHRIGLASKLEQLENCAAETCRTVESQVPGISLRRDRSKRSIRRRQGRSTTP